MDGDSRISDEENLRGLEGLYWPYSLQRETLQEILDPASSPMPPSRVIERDVVPLSLLHREGLGDL